MTIPRLKAEIAAIKEEIKPLKSQLLKLQRRLATAQSVEKLKEKKLQPETESHDLM